jgi:hypothetical protein
MQGKYNKSNYFMKQLTAASKEEKNGARLTPHSIFLFVNIHEN